MSISPKTATSHSDLLSILLRLPLSHPMNAIDHSLALVAWSYHSIVLLHILEPNVILMEVGTHGITPLKFCYFVISTKAAAATLLHVESAFDCQS